MAVSLAGLLAAYLIGAIPFAVLAMAGTAWACLCWRPMSDSNGSRRAILGSATGFGAAAVAAGLALGLAGRFRAVVFAWPAGFAGAFACAAGAAGLGAGALAAGCWAGAFGCWAACLGWAVP